MTLPMFESVPDDRQINEKKVNHQRFLKHLSESEKAVWVAAIWLNSKGYPVKVNVAPKATRRDEWKNYADHGDLEIVQRVEVKRLGVNFNDYADWPFGDKFIVCAKHAFDRAMPKPHAFIILSNDFASVAIVKGDTFKYWYVEVRADSRYESVEQKFYFCPIELVEFHRINIF